MKNIAVVCETDLQAINNKLDLMLQKIADIGSGELLEFERPLGRKEAAGYLDVSVQTLDNWRRSGIIKGHNINAKVYFFRAELIQAIQSGATTKYRRKK